MPRHDIRTALLVFACITAAAAASTDTCSIKVSNTRSHPVSRWVMGCHLDLGYAHEGLGLSSDMLYGRNFQRVPDNNVLRDSINATNWVGSTAASGLGAVFLDAATAWPSNGQPTMQITHNGEAHEGLEVGVANRGLGNEGLKLEAGKPYVGSVFALASEAIDLTVSLRNVDASTSSAPLAPLASQVLRVPGTGKWTRLDFTLEPSAGTTCEGIDSKTAWEEHAVGCPNGMKENHFTPNEYVDDKRQYCRILLKVHYMPGY
jgi:hypothetical protein